MLLTPRRRPALGEPRRYRRRGVVLSALLSVLLVAGGVIGFLASQRATTDPPRPGASDIAGLDMRGQPVRYDPGIRSDPEARPVPDSGRRFVVPSAGLDVPLGAISVARGQIVPPGFRSVYLIRDRGVSLANPTSGTVYAATHALRGGTAPGNFLIDVRNQRSSLVPGTSLLVGGLTYHVTGARVVAKADLSTDRDIWANRPGRLVLITCFQLAADQPAWNNLVITAELGVHQR